MRLGIDADDPTAVEQLRRDLAYLSRIRGRTEKAVTATVVFMCIAVLSAIGSALVALYHQVRG